VQAGCEVCAGYVETFRHPRPTLGGPDQCAGLDSAPKALTTLFDRGSTALGKRVVRITDG
jgi:hypothetical protein